MREYIVKEIVNDNFNSLSPSIYLRILWTRVPKIKHKWLQIYQLSIILTILKLYLKYWNHMYNSSLLIIHNIGQDIKILNKFLEIYFSKKKKKRENRLLFKRITKATFLASCGPASPFPHSPSSCSFCYPTIFPPS